jgi:hypothetical protein
VSFAAAPTGPAKHIVLPRHVSMRSSGDAKPFASKYRAAASVHLENAAMKGKTKQRALTHERLREVLDYNPATGVFTWKVNIAKNVKAGSVAGGLPKGTGYTYIRINGEEITATRLAWFYMTKQWPERRVRYKNSDITDHRFENLTLFNGIGGEFDFKSPQGRAAYLRAYRAATPHLEKGRALRQSFGISLDHFNEMLAAQDGKCGICGSREAGTRGGKSKAFAVDHCHKSGKIRGLLCESCNQGIGKLKEDRNILLAAVAYLDRHTLEPMRYAASARSAGR